MPSRHEIARLSRVFGMTMAEVRAMTFRDAEALAEVIVREAHDRKRRAQASQNLARARPRRG